MDLNNDVLTHLLSSSGGAGAVAGAVYMAIRRLIARMDKVENELSDVKESNIKLQAKVEFLERK